MTKTKTITPTIMQQPKVGKLNPNHKVYNKILHDKAVANHKFFENVTRIKEEKGYIWIVNDKSTCRRLVPPKKVPKYISEGWKIIQTAIVD